MGKKTSTDSSTREIFRKDDALFDDSLQKELEEQKNQPVECLGKTFPNDDARREYFLARLTEFLQDPEFRKTSGFPRGLDEDILQMSDPPYYTACPNPFVEQFITHYGTTHSPDEEYHRDPFAIDVSVGKTDALYRAHGYHTKVPHLAIIPSILHYTRPNEIVLDGFAGSGMTGIAAQLCGTAPESFRKQLEQEWKTAGYEAPEWGTRRAVLNDLGPAATFITAGYNIPFDVHEFERASLQVLEDVEAELGWMYETRHDDGETMGRIDYTVWSEVFLCPECGGEVIFIEQALDRDTNTVRKSFACPTCAATLTKRQLDRCYEARFDSVLGESVKLPKRVPVFLLYTVGTNRLEKRLDDADIATLRRIAEMPLPPDLPSIRFPMDDMWEAPRLAGHGITHVHHMFLPRAAHVIASLWRSAGSHPDSRMRTALLFFVEQAIWGMSLLARYAPTHFSQVNQYLSGVYYVPAQLVDASPWYILGGKRTRLCKAFSSAYSTAGATAISTGDCASLPIASASVDYVFTDPPFGDNFPYSELNFSIEAWHRVFTAAGPEAVVERSKANRSTQKGIAEYQDLMRCCFTEYWRVLKPGRWITIVFSNSRNVIWHAIQESLGIAGFVVADVRTLDKKQGSFKQITSAAVKQDLVISAYKPTDALTRCFQLGTSTPDGAWAFVREHLSNVPVAVKQGGSLQVLVERTPQMLYDRMIAFHVQRGIGVPLSSAEFSEGLGERFAERDGMYFLSDQVAEYDRKRSTIEQLQQLELFVSDESTAIQWLRRELKEKPQSFQDLQPQFMRETSGWSKHESPLDLRVLLEQNFICYDGKLEIPSQIHSYLSSNFKGLRNKSKDDGSLRSKGKDRWYVPDPSKAGDLEKLRERQLLKEFEEYRGSKAKRLKVFRTEAIRVGFKMAYDTKEYRTIIDVAEKLPDRVLQEDEKLLMYYDVALMRLGEDGDNTDLI